MKSLTLAALISSFSAFSASAAGIFYSFDTLTTGNGVFNGDETAKTANVTTNDGFGTPSLTYAGTVPSTGMLGGTTFTAFDGTTWQGSGGTGTPGHSLVWNPGSTGNTFSLTFSTLSLSNLVIRLDARAGASSGTNIGGFSAFSYSINGGTAVAVGTNPAFTTATSYQVWTVDLSTATSGAIDNQNQVTLTWNIGDMSSARSLRVDNLQITAIPEPCGWGMLVAGAGLMGLRRRRK